MNNFINLEKCPVCGHNRKMLVYTVDDCSGLEQKFDLIKCKNCHHVYVTPVPSKSFLKHYYPDEYYSYNIDIDKTNKKFKYRIKKWIYEYDGNFRILKQIFLRIIEKHIAILPTQKTGKILDVGCGTGSFLSLMKAVGWDLF
ncbi:MAG: hypothetical protein RMJ67_05930 [Elusimicrobiota bacterium]|nr:hypothetical protein [Endomicrobiia bacterium]MDW8166031.1 hypothetical protein [Elusimicrobiota bacterium]